MITVEDARKYYEDNDAAHDFDHVLRVWSLAGKIAKAEGADIEIVCTAALLHDVGRVEQELTGRSHAELGRERAAGILAGRDPLRVQAVCHAIAAHRFRDSVPPQTLEAEVLYDADKLDAIGAVGVARAYAYGGMKGQRLWGDVERGYEAWGDLPGEHTPLHEFVFKLSKLKDGLYTDTARSMGAARHAYMLGFFQRLGTEIQGEV